jgi:2-polyprenyl-3-methyl-5-hydroxy-6-metoxy-1,4-benzoquinol methylase
VSLATEYDQWHTKVFDADPEHPDESSPWYKLVLEFLAPVQGKRILEVACGRGGFSRLLASKGAIVCGADFSESAIGIAKEKLLRNPALADRVTYVQADAQNLPFDAGSFDIVISCETIEHVPDPSAAACEMARVCRSNGLLYLTTPNYMNFIGLYELYAAASKTKKHSEFAQPLDRHSVFFQTRNLVRAAGWRILHSDGTVHQLPIPGRNPATLHIVEKYRWIRRCLCPLALHYLIVAQKQDFHR